MMWRDAIVVWHAALNNAQTLDDRPIYMPLIVNSHKLSQSEGTGRDGKGEMKESSWGE